MLKYAYHYDKLGQLVRVDDNVAGYTYTYQYDKAGNITYKHTHYLTSPDNGIGSPIDTDFYDYSTSAWGDLLTKYNNVSITYDTIGNPLTYHNGFTFTWKQGRRLAEARKGSIEIFFKYNDEGIRTSKTVNGVVHTYHLAGSRIIAEEWGNNLLIYLYDADGSPIGMQYRKSTDAIGTFNTYWFEKNLQGDIVAVYNEGGYKLVSYVYDAWGNVATPTYYNNGDSTAAQYNPFRYRGYYYDTELGFYYLNSRYYDPETSRFISADTYLGANADINSYNQFAYCSNNPIRYIDPSGEFILSLVIACAIVGVAAGFGITAYTDYVDDGEVFNGSVGVEDYVANTIVGGLAGAAAGYVAPSIWTFLSSSFTMTTTAFVGEVATAITVTGANVLAVGSTLALIGMLTFDISMHGPPNTDVQSGGSYGRYDENGNLSFRTDTTGRAHYIKELKDYFLPHTHHFSWKLINGVWRYVQKIWPV